VKDGAVACPFCGAAFVAASLTVPPPGVRSTAIAAATAVAIAAGACSPSSPALEPAYGLADSEPFDAYQAPETSVEDTGAFADATQEAAPMADASADGSGEGAVDGGTDASGATD
jgi:hypothetical protein